MLRVRNAIAIIFRPSPIDCFVLDSFATETPPVGARISTAGQGACYHDNNVAMIIFVELFVPAQTAYNQLPCGSSCGGYSTVWKETPTPTGANSVDNLVR
jgi:hypothetical protein